MRKTQRLLNELKPSEYNDFLTECVIECVGIENLKENKLPSSFIIEEMLVEKLKAFGIAPSKQTLLYASAYAMGLMNFEGHKNKLEKETIETI